MSKSALDQKLTMVANAIDTLQKQWELFFSGQRKLPPYKEKTLLEKEFRTLRNTHIQDNTHRFKVLNLQTRFSVYLEMWNRRMRELEEGPLHFKRRKVVSQQIAKKLEEIQCSDDSSGKHDRAKPTDKKSNEILIHDPRTENELMNRLYEQYVEEVEKVQKRRPTITLDLFTSRIGQQIEDVERKRGCDAVTVSLARDDEGKVKVRFKAVKESK